ncbi:hypothetical protein, partial [Phenylobacterium sp.]|uniref:hypothetical protein n=1 Tax=Phenylobacterium sp. TaxID=1871053 RepID=UPI002F3E2407
MNRIRLAEDKPWVIRFERKTGRWILAPRHRYPGPALVLLEWAAVTAAACAMLMGGLFAGLYQARPDLDLQSRAFADASVAAIAPTLSTGELFARASPDFIDSASDAFRADFRNLAALGPGGANQGCHGRSRIEPLGVYSVVTAQYTCELRSKTAQSVLVLS